jgi:dimethylsulfoniopropionate demethylase
MPPFLSISRRTRRTPFTDRVTAAGVKAYTIYNHMLLPTVFRSVTEDYRHLKTAVQVWDVACERQVEVRGPQAAELVQMLTPRDLSDMTIGQCLYTPMVDETGGMLNDPVTVKLDEDRYWVSIADSDLLFWVKALAHGFRLAVDVFEPDVSPLAIQGPQADELAARVFGDAVRSIRFFRYKRLSFNGTELVVARSGYSKQGGFEIYVEGSQHGEPLWDALFEAGRDLDVRAGQPLYAARKSIHSEARGRPVPPVEMDHHAGDARRLLHHALADRWDRPGEVIAPDQAVLIDMANRRFYFFFIEIWPQEFFYVAGLLVMAGVGLFLVTSVVGRAWCGYTCPQTVWTICSSRSSVSGRVTAMRA